MTLKKIDFIPLSEEYRGEVISMMKTFYSSPAVLTDGSEKIFNLDIDACIGEEPFLKGYVFEICDKDGSKGIIVGYAMLSFGFSTESGKKRLWIEDLYVKEEYRGHGVGGLFLDFISVKYADCVIRLDVEEENVQAVNMYKKHGFEFLPYLQMMKNE